HPCTRRMDGLLTRLLDARRLRAQRRQLSLEGTRLLALLAQRETLRVGIEAQEHLACGNLLTEPQARLHDLPRRRRVDWVWCAVDFKARVCTDFIQREAGQCPTDRPDLYRAR